MTLTQILQLLADADAGYGEGPGGRHAALMYLPPDQAAEIRGDDGTDDGGDDTTDGADRDPDDQADPEDENEGDADLVLTPLGEADSLLGALDLLGRVLCRLVPEETIEEALPPDEPLLWFDEDTNQEIDLYPFCEGLYAPARRAVLALCAGRLAGPFYAVAPAAAPRDVYLADAQRRYDGARFVFGMGASPPNHEQAFCILALQPTGKPSSRVRALHQACARGDATAVTAALRDGPPGLVDALDRRGASPLHHAVAHRHEAVVAALLAAGARVNRQAAFGNAPLFARLRAEGRVRPDATVIDDELHWRILQQLIEAGADVNARSTRGLTVLDLVLETLADPPAYPEARVAWLRTRGAKSGELAGVHVGELLRLLPYGDLPALRRTVLKLRYLLESGADASDPRGSSFNDPPLQALIGTTGYSEREVPGDVLEELVALLLRHGARDRVGWSGRTALQHAESWVAHGFQHYDAVVRLLRTL